LDGRDGAQTGSSSGPEHKAAEKDFGEPRINPTAEAAFDDEAADDEAAIEEAAEGGGTAPCTSGGCCYRGEDRGGFWLDQELFQ
jgi:hypothetical protein